MRLPWTSFGVWAAAWAAIIMAAAAKLTDKNKLFWNMLPPL